MNQMTRATAVKTAAVISFLSAVFSILASIPLLAQGAEVIDQSMDAPPYFIIVLGFTLGIVAVIAAIGAWKQQRWGVILTIIINLLNGLSAAPGIFIAPQLWLTIAATVTVILSILITVLCLWRDPKPALA